MQKRTIIVITVLVLLVGAVALYAVAALDADDAPPALVEREWILERYGPLDAQQAVLPESEITLIFQSDEETLGGNAGVNHYSASYRINGNEIEISNIIQTLIMGPVDLMEQESAYLSALRTAESFRVEGNVLEIDTADGGRLVFQAR